MAFQTFTRLDTHIKYSQVHAINVRSFLEVARPEDQTNTDGESGEDCSVGGSEADVGGLRSSMVTGQKEGVHYKMLYSGHKLFFRSQETLEIRIFVHLIAGTVEIIAYDTLRNREVPRLYFSVDALKRHLASSVHWRVQQRRSVEQSRTSGRSRGRSPAMCDDSKDVLEQKAFVSALLSRVYQTPALAGAPAGIEVAEPSPLDSDYLSSMESARENGDLVAISYPSSVVPVSIAWRRRSTSQEISNFLAEVEVGQENLRVSVDKAARISDTVLGAVDLLKDLGRAGSHRHPGSRAGSAANSPQKCQPTTAQASDGNKDALNQYSENTCSSGGWVKVLRWAVHKVVLQRRVARTRRHLQWLEKKKTLPTICTEEEPDVVPEFAASPSKIRRDLLRTEY